MVSYMCVVEKIGVRRVVLCVSTFYQEFLSSVSVFEVFGAVKVEESPICFHA